MGKQFEEGHTYEATESGYDPITIIKRTAKSVRVSNGQNKWMMRIRLDKDGNEYVTDSCVSPKWREAFTYRAIWEIDA